jgi:hypothetical protein
MKTFLSNYSKKLRESAIGAASIIAIIILVQAILGSWMDTQGQIYFAISIAFMIMGQALFLTAINGSILTMGELVGANIQKLKKLPIILLFGFIFGTVATIAEPAVSVLSDQVTSISGLNQFLLTLSVSVGIGIFVAYALLRIFLSFPVKISFFILYAITFMLMFFTPEAFKAIAFDFSGATTGSITVPFILSLGVGVCAVLNKKNQDDSYGLIGLASIGPIITCAVMAIIFGADNSAAETVAEISPNLLQTLFSGFINIVIALAPIAVIFFIFNFMFIKLPKSKLLQISTALLLVVAGLTLFVSGVNLGISPAGAFIGTELTNPSGEEFMKYLIIPLGFVLGFAVAYAEPALRVLGDQIEGNTQGKIKKNTLIFTLAVSIGLTLLLGMIRILFEIPILWLILPIVATGCMLMPFTPKLFVGIAFDSGGVATGTITAAFIGSFAIAVCSSLNIEQLIFGFGMIALICTIPIPTICLLGFIYNQRLNKTKKFIPKAATANILLKKSKDALQIFCIICKRSLETDIADSLCDFGIRIATTMNARGSGRAPTSALDITPEEKVCIIGVITKTQAVNMIQMLELHFNFADLHSGIAWTIPIESIK